MDWIEKQNDDFCKWLQDIGKLEKVCANGKTFMVNPKAIQTIMKLNAFFKTKSDEHIQKCKSVGIECQPYLIKLAMGNESSPWFGFETYYIATDEDGISFSKAEQKKFDEICSENINGITFSANKYDGVSITMVIENFYIEVK